jgi:diguanylate cyclase (GGDEF)-like protein/PAS domain S-box-containing protein
LNGGGIILGVLTMSFEYNSYFAVLSATALISAMVAVTAWKRRKTCSASQPFIGLMLAIAGYATAAALEAGAIDLSDKIFWSKLEYAGSGSVISFFLIFALDFTHRRRWLTQRKLALLWAIPTLNFVMVATNEWHHLVWAGFITYPNTSYIAYEHGFGFFWAVAWIYIYTLAGIFLLAKVARRSSILHRHQSRLVMLGAVIPMIGGTLYTFSLTPPGLNTTPMSFMLTGLVYFVSLFHLRMFDLVPIARDTLIENMSDGVLVLDLQQRIVDLNLAAQRLTGLSSACVGQPIDQVLPQWQTLFDLHRHPKNLQTELVFNGTTQYYIEFRLTLLYDRFHRLTGRLLVLRDITQQHQAEVELRRANQQLQQQLTEIERLQIQLQEQAIRDGLTHLFNRRHFEETLSKELSQAAREGYPVAIILIDVDHFKKVNDTFGHQGGDRVLQALGQLLLQHSRASDTACRYGGEEFVLVLPKMGLDSAYERAETIRQSFQHTQVILNDDRIQTTLSGGVGIFPGNGETGEVLLHEVDQALYVAKAAGRNQIQRAQQQTGSV